jgi:hypothetical protein
MGLEPTIFTLGCWRLWRGQESCPCRGERGISGDHRGHQGTDFLAQDSNGEMSEIRPWLFVLPRGSGPDYWEAITILYHQKSR